MMADDLGRRLEGVALEEDAPILVLCGEGVGNGNRRGGGGAARVLLQRLRLEVGEGEGLGLGGGRLHAQDLLGAVAGDDGARDDVVQQVVEDEGCLRLRG
jgi:hypothetical protein